VGKFVNSKPVRSTTTAGADLDEDASAHVLQRSDVDHEDGYVDPFRGKESAATPLKKRRKRLEPGDGAQALRALVDDSGSDDEPAVVVKGAAKDVTAGARVSTASKLAGVLTTAAAAHGLQTAQVRAILST